MSGGDLRPEDQPVASEDSSGVGGGQAARQTCAGCGADQPRLALECRECGAALGLAATSGRRWLIGAVVAGVVLVGAVVTYTVITTMFEARERPETDIVWELGFAVARDDPQVETWSTGSLGHGAMLFGPSTTVAIDVEAGSVRWSARIETEPVGLHGHRGVTDGDLVVALVGAGVVGIDARSGGELWRYVEPGAHLNEIAAADGIAVINFWPAPGEPGESASLAVALDLSDGEQLWSHRPGQDEGISSVAVDGDRVYLSWVELEQRGDDRVVVRAVVDAHDRQSGERVWRLEEQGEDLHRLEPVPFGDHVAIVDPDRVIVVHAVDGGHRWSYDAEAHLSDPVSARDVIVVLEAGRGAGELVAIDEEGERWRWSAPDGWMGSLVADPDLVFTVTRDDGTWTGHAVDVGSGETRWDVDLGQETEGLEHRPAPVLVDDAVVVVDTERALRAFDRRAGEERWSIRPATQRVTTAPPEVVDGSLLHLVSAHGMLYVIDLDDRAQIWSQRLGRTGWSTAVRSEDHLVATSALGELRAYDLRSGDEAWRTERLFDDVHPDSPRPITVDGLIVAAAGRQIVGVDADRGEAAWSGALDGEVRGLTAVEGGVIVAEAGGTMRTLTTDGDQQWFVDTGAALETAPVVVERIVIVSSGTRIVAIRLDGSDLVWERDLRAGVGASITAGANLIFVPDGDVLLAVDPSNGETRWQTEVGESITGQPHVAEGRIHVTTDTGGVIQLDADSGEFQRRLETDARLASSPSLHGDTVYVLTDERRQRLIALE